MLTMSIIPRALVSSRMKNSGPAGAGAVLFDSKGDKRAEESRYLGETTNNVAEYQALLLGLELARNQGAPAFIIFGYPHKYFISISSLYQSWLESEWTISAH